MKGFLIPATDSDSKVMIARVGSLDGQKVEQRKDSRREEGRKEGAQSTVMMANWMDRTTERTEGMKETGMKVWVSRMVG